MLGGGALGGGGWGGGEAVGREGETVHQPQLSDPITPPYPYQKTWVKHTSSPPPILTRTLSKDIKTPNRRPDYQCNSTSPLSENRRCFGVEVAEVITNRSYGQFSTILYNPSSQENVCLTGGVAWESHRLPDPCAVSRRGQLCAPPIYYFAW